MNIYLEHTLSGGTVLQITNRKEQTTAMQSGPVEQRSLSSGISQRPNNYKIS